MNTADLAKLPAKEIERLALFVGPGSGATATPEELEPFRALGIEIIQAEPGQEDGIRRVA